MSSNIKKTRQNHEIYVKKSKPIIKSINNKYIL